ncbi:MAG: DNA gyrase subunit A [Eubacteriales bacterium]
MKKKKEQAKQFDAAKAVIHKSGITETLRVNYMPYAMSVIVSRALPEIDGFKPAHRKLLYTMYTMGLLKGGRTKSANIVGQTMKLNPHGDAAIYETMVRMTRGYEALLLPYVDSKGSFGKHYSRDMAYAASRYTEAKLDESCSLLFEDIDKDTVDFVDNYDGKMKEPTLLPTRYPNILANGNQGIAVGMACNICSFNLRELCETTIALMKDPGHDVASTLLAPDFPTGGELVYDEAALRSIYETGRGSVRLRSVYSYDKKNNCIDITEIPYTATEEAIIDKIVDLVKSGKVREVADIRDETDLTGLKITIDLKRGTDPDKLMQKLFRLTPLTDTFACNFNILVGGAPRVMGVREILTEWVAFRSECIKRRSYFECSRKQKRLHLLEGLSRILLDIDKAIRIIRETEKEAEVVPNLMIGFGIDEEQAEYIAEIKLRNLNRQYILRALEDIDRLKEEIADLQALMGSPARIRWLIEKDLREISKKYGQDRKTRIVYQEEEPEPDEESMVEDYPVHAFLTREGYFKKITPQSLRMSGEHKLKEGDRILSTWECTNKCHLLVFTNRCQVYKLRLYELEDTKASLLGEYLPARLGMDEGEMPVGAIITADYQGYVLFCYDNGRAAKIPLSSYETKTNRKKLTGAYCEKFPLVALLHLPQEEEVVLTASNGKVLCFHSQEVPIKAARASQGVIVMTLRAKSHRVVEAVKGSQSGLTDPLVYRPRSLPSAGYALKLEDEQRDQMTL